MWCRRCVLVAFMWLVVPGVAVAQHYQSHFPPEEFKARWEKVFSAIGGDKAVAIVQGCPRSTASSTPRQTNEFYYLCGVETPQAYLVLDGQKRKATLYLPPRNPLAGKRRGQGPFRR